MRRVLCLHLPLFAVELVARRREENRSQHVVLTETVGLRVQVARCCRGAEQLGIRVGMALADAHSLLGATDQLLVEAHDPARDARALAGLGQWALQLSPVVALCPPDGLLLEAAGFERLMGVEAHFVQHVVGRTNALGLTANCAVASTVGAAWGLARFAASTRAAIVAAGDERDALLALPIEALRLDRATCSALGELGIERVEHLLALERKRLPGRFGAHILERLDQALGHAFESVVPLRPEEPVEIERLSKGLVRNIGEVLRVTEAMVHEFATELGSAGLGVRTLLLEIASPDHPAQPIEVSFGRVTANARHLWTMLRPRAEKVQLGFGIERITLTATRAERLGSKQSNSFEEETEANSDRVFGELVDLLALRLGTEAVRRVRAVATHIPEHAFETRAAKSTTARAARSRDDDSVVQAPRPTIVFRSPEPIQTEPHTTTHTAVPQHFRWRGQSFEVASSDGPECIDRAWWTSGAPPARAYFRVCTTSGRHLWLCLAAGRLFVHGEWA